MINILLFVHILVGILLIISILLQKTSSDSIANLAGGQHGLMSPKGVASFLTKTTTILATVFMVNAIILGNLSTTKPKNIFDEKVKTEKAKIPIAE
ncbi:preprotein translocase subunit SecG [Candidatus Phycorickettsia trachydisci]|uniref:Protein-export membrane protein SecG n=1 Tax=Candidatus Phycorickettsia trachydisci TaxID=2115978 RepID=A0A2P1P7L2_9RICK|nr:preprotein translocase subunit SecG [Candidatus Phycorickettsia trachydisci]AVP87252.1 preprotein translocase subunit SecG [Candidatus Phycorickettsia trachydisci]